MLECLSVECTPGTPLLVISIIILVNTPGPWPGQLASCTAQPKNVSDFYVGVFIRSSAERRVFRLINSSQEPTSQPSASPASLLQFLIR